MTHRQLPALALALLLSAACAPTPESVRHSSSTVSATPERPWLTQEEARRIHDRYWQVMAETARAHGKGIERGDAGLALELSRTQFRLDALRNKPPTPPHAISNVTFVIPRTLPGQSRWFLAPYPSSTSCTHLIFNETAAGWRVVAGSITPADRPLPRPATDQDGLAIPLSEHDKSLTASPWQVAQAHAASMSVFDPDIPAHKLLAPGPHTSRALQRLRVDHAALRGQWRLGFHARALPDIYALRTPDGGALAWYGLRDTQTFTPAITSHGSISFNAPNVAVLSNNRSFTRRAVVEGGGWFLAAIPSAAAGRLTDIIGNWYLTMRVSGS